MPFFSQYQVPDSIVHNFSNDWTNVVQTALPDSDVLVPNKSIIRDIVRKRRDLRVRSFHDLITMNLSSVLPSQRCYWIQDLSHLSTCSRVSVTSAERHEHANSQGLWWNDIWIDEQRKFGLEMELTSDDFISTSSWKNKEWRGRAGIIHAFLREALGASRVCSRIGYTSKPSYTQWQVVYDQSAGWEIVSPILCGKEGVYEMMTVMELIHELRTFGFILKKNTGMHIHLSWDESVQKTKNLLHWWRYLEPSIETLVHPSRIFAHHKGYFCKTYNNGYCVPLSQSTDGQYIQEAEDIYEICLEIARQTSVNPHSIHQKKSIEFRMFEATSDPLLALVWLSLCQQIAHLVSKNKVILPMVNNWESNVLTPTGDIVLFCYTYLPAGYSEKFLNLLIHRRRQVAAHWCRNTSLHQWLPFMRSWRTSYGD